MKAVGLLLLLIVFSCKQESSPLDGNKSSVLDSFDFGETGSKSSELDSKFFSEQASLTRQQLAKLLVIDTSNLSFDEKIDWQFAQSILRGRENRQTHHDIWKKDPRYYMRFRNLGNIIERPGEPKDKIVELENLLTLIPRQLQNGSKQIEFYVPRFQELGLFMAQNAYGLFEDQLPEFIRQTPEAEHLNPLVTESKKGLDNFINFIKNDITQLPEGEFAFGNKAYNLMLNDEFLLDYDDQSLWEFGQNKFEETVSELEMLALEIDPSKTWQELAIEIKNSYPDPEKMIEAHQLWVDSARAHLLNKNLIPIPWSEQVLVVPRAEYLRKTSYYGNFSRAREKDENGIFTAKWMINPFEDQWDTQTKMEYLVEHDWGVIIVTAPHEAYGGHHVQSLYQMHNPSKIRRENGLSLFSEGWGLYNEQLMSETGFFPDKKIHLRQLQLRLWRNARVIYDVGLHTGKMSYEDAISLMTDRVGFLRWAAQLEIDAAVARPGYFIGYYIGMTEILKMRHKYRQKLGPAFTLSDFHERLLKIGNMPPALLQESLLKDL